MCSKQEPGKGTKAGLCAVLKGLGSGVARMEQRCMPSTTHLCTHQVHARTCKHRRKLERGHLPEAAVQVSKSSAL